MNINLRTVGVVVSLMLTAACFPQATPPTPSPTLAPPTSTVRPLPSPTVTPAPPTSTPTPTATRTPTVSELMGLSPIPEAEMGKIGGADKFLFDNGVTFELLQQKASLALEVRADGSIWDTAGKMQVGTTFEYSDSQAKQAGYALSLNTVRAIASLHEANTGNIPFVLPVTHAIEIVAVKSPKGLYVGLATRGASGAVVCPTTGAIWYPTTETTTEHVITIFGTAQYDFFLLLAKKNIAGERIECELGETLQMLPETLTNYPKILDLAPTGFQMLGVAWEGATPLTVSERLLCIMGPDGQPKLVSVWDKAPQP